MIFVFFVMIAIGTIYGLTHERRDDLGDEKCTGAFFGAGFDHTFTLWHGPPHAFPSLAHACSVCSLVRCCSCAASLPCNTRAGPL